MWKSLILYGTCIAMEILPDLSIMSPPNFFQIFTNSSLSWKIYAYLIEDCLKMIHDYSDNTKHCLVQFKVLLF